METNSNENNPNNPSATISAAFPAPPPFYKSFTPGNLALVAAHQEETRHAASSSPSQSANLLPEDARHLIPPPPPRDGKYRSFGVLHDISVPALPSSSSSLQQAQQSPQPRSQPPTPQRLLAITHNILLTFLSLTHALASAPSAYAPIWDQLHALFQDAHAVVNDYRPHQARETLIAMMEAQVAKGREEGRSASEMGARVKAVLEGLGGGGEVAVDSRELGSVNGSHEHGARGEEREGDEETKRVWEVVGREVGFV